MTELNINKADDNKSKKEYLKNYYENNKDKIRIQQQEYYKNNKEHLREQQKEYFSNYYIENKPKIIDKNKSLCYSRTLA